MAALSGEAAEPFEYIVTIDPIPAEVLDADKAVAFKIPAAWGQPHLLLGFHGQGVARMIATVTRFPDGRAMESSWSMGDDGCLVVQLVRSWCEPPTPYAVSNEMPERLT